MNWLKVPKKVYFKTGCYPVALKELDEVYGFGKAFIISDANLYTTGVVEPIKNYLKERGLAVCEFFTLSETPCFADARSGRNCWYGRWRSYEYGKDHVASL